jgi:hypothetical protein
MYGLGHKIIMNISGISSSVTSFSQNNMLAGPRQQGQNFKALDTALQTGDLSSAQSAFSAIQQNMPPASNGPEQGQPGADGMGQAFQSLSDALGKGDLSGAQTAFSDVKDIMKAGGPRPPMGGGDFGSEKEATDSSALPCSTGMILNAEA